MSKVTRRIVRRLADRFKWGAYHHKVMHYNPIAYWPLWESAGATANCLTASARNGAYIGVTLGQPGIGDGRGVPYFDATNDYINTYSANLVAALNGAEGTLVAWVRANSAALWTDGSHHVIAYIVDTADYQNYVEIRKSATNGHLRWRYCAAGVLETLNKYSVAATGWMCLALSWSKSAELASAYYDGGLVATSSTLGVWNGSINVILIGADTTTPTSVWHGWIGHVQLYDYALSATHIQDIYRCA